MRVIVRGRQAGKTTELLAELLGTRSGIMLVVDQNRKEHVLRMIRDLGVHQFDAGRIITFSDQARLREKMRGYGYDWQERPVYIDDLEASLPALLGLGQRDRIAGIVINGYPSTGAHWPNGLQLIEPTKPATWRERRAAARQNRRGERERLGEWDAIEEDPKW